MRPEGSFFVREFFELPPRGPVVLVQQKAPPDRLRFVKIRYCDHITDIEGQVIFMLAFYGLGCLHCVRIRMRPCAVSAVHPTY